MRILEMKTQKIGIYVDSQNCRKFSVYQSDVLNFAKETGKILIANVYYNSNCDNEINFISKIDSNNFTFKDVPCLLKNSSDNQIIADILKDKKNLDQVILITGDGDFQYIVETLKESENKVTIIAQKGNVKQQLIEIADEFHYLDELSQLTEQKSTLSTISSLQISYEEAVKMLIETIKKALQQNRKPSISSIWNLMRKIHNLPKKFPSINKNGQTIYKFGKLVDNAVKDGLLIKNNDCLILANS